MKSETIARIIQNRKDAVQWHLAKHNDKTAVTYTPIESITLERKSYENEFTTCVGCYFWSGANFCSKYYESHEDAFIDLLKYVKFPVCNGAKYFGVPLENIKWLSDG